MLMTLVCGMTAAWAGTGDGSKDNPYTGEWTVSAIMNVLKEGDYLAYNCVIKGGRICVDDTKLNVRVVNGWAEWAAGSPISDSPFECYRSYCTWNPLNERKSQTFIISAVDFTNDKFCLSGYYSGMYLTTNAEGYLEVRTGAEFATAIKANPGEKIKLEADIDVRGLGTICDTFRGQIYGKYKYTTEDGLLRDSVYSLDGGGAWISPLFNRFEYAKIEYVMLYNIKVAQTGDNIGSLANTASHTEFSYVMMQDVNVSTSNDNAGGMIGKADNCNFEHVTWSNCSVLANGVGAGGLVGESSDCTFAYCKNNMRNSVFADGRTVSNYAKAGGYSGYSKNDTFTECLNTATVGGNEDSVGGFAGRSDGSDFTSCINTGVIVHAAESEFNNVVSAIHKALDKLVLKKTDLQYVLYFAGIAAGTIGGVYSAIAVGAGVGFLLEGSGLLDIAIGAMVGFSALGVFAVVAVAAIAATIVAVSLITEHDEIGGISGYAIGGQFALCTNRGLINCKDSQGGGIVGRAEGVTVNNCLHTQECKWGDTDCGSIIGEATEGCKVTNCVSAMSYPIIGSASDMNTASGNNYSLKTGDNDWEMTVTEDQLNSGIVTHWLNNGVENRTSGVKPWRQTLGEDGDKSPVLDATHDEVNDEDIIEFKITTAEELIAFSKHVNEENQFATACLLNDIDMTGKTWVPIGKDGFTTNFRGFFDGRGHTISGLRCESNEAVGLFGTVHHGAEIRNVIIGADCVLTGTGNSGVGAIVGEVPIGWHWGHVVIENCANYGKVTAKDAVNAGGILGLVRNNTNDNVHIMVSNCYNMGTVTAQNGNSALLCGYMRNSGIVTNCWSAGQLRTSTSGVKPYDDTQGRPEYFVGYMDKLDIKNCCVIGKEENVDGVTSDSQQAGVESYTAAALSSGEFTYHINGNTNDVSQSLSWQQELGVDAMPKWGSKGVYHTRTVSNAIGTVCLPYALKSDDEVTYYRFEEAKNEDGNIVMSFYSTDDVMAGEPVLFRAAKTGELTFRGAGVGWNDIPGNTASPYTDWFIAGTYDEKVFNETTTPSSDCIYYISKGEIHNAKRITIAPFRAYIGGPSVNTLTSNGTSARVRIVIDGEENEAVALQFVMDDVLPAHQSGKAYTLFGTEAGEGYRGIVIRGGKKQLIY